MPRHPLLSRSLLSLALGLLTTIAIAWTSAATGTLDDTARWRTEQASQKVRLDVRTYSGLAAERRRLGFDSSYLVDNGALAAGARDEAARLRQTRVFPAWWAAAPPLLDRAPALEVEPALDAAPPMAWAVFELVQDARGWPVPALWCEWDLSGNHLTASTVRGGLPLAQRRGGLARADTVRALPYRPIPLGLTADTLLFALAWSALLFALRALRTRLRRHRGLCVTCAYNLAGLPHNSPCPECGHAAPSAS